LPPDVFFSSSRCTKPVFGRGSAPDPVAELMTLPQIPIRLERAELPLIQLSVSPPKEAEARQTFPGFFLKSLLESPGNLLD